MDCRGVVAQFPPKLNPSERAASDEGRNYAVSVDEGVATFRVWKRNDLEAAQMVKLAGDLANAASILAQDQFLAHAAIFDVRDAPAEAAPGVQEAYVRLLASWEKAKRRVAIVVGTDAIQRLLMHRLSRDHAPKWSRVLTTTIEAKAWLSTPSV
jgi:hypothetical protein